MKTSKVIRKKCKSTKNLMSDERGLSTVEYVILLVLIAAACVGLWSTFGKTISEKITQSTEEIDNHTTLPSGDDK